MSEILKEYLKLKLPESTIEERLQDLEKTTTFKIYNCLHNLKLQLLAAKYKRKKNGVRDKQADVFTDYWDDVKKLNMIQFKKLGIALWDDGNLVWFQFENPDLPKFNKSRRGGVDYIVEDYELAQKILELEEIKVSEPTEEVKNFTNRKIRHLLIMERNVKEVINDEFAVHIKRNDGDTITEFYEDSEQAFKSFKQISIDLQVKGFIYLEQ